MTWQRPPCALAGGPSASRVAIEVQDGRGTATIFVRGELDLVTMPFLAERLTPVRTARPGRLVFDLAGTSFMDCGSARLIAGAGRWLADGGRPVIRNAGPSVRRVFELAGLDARCEIEG